MNSTRTHDGHDERHGFATWARAGGMLLSLSAFFLLQTYPPDAKADSIYGIRRNGEMQFYRFDGVADGSNRWAVQQKVIGVGWQDFSRVLAGDNGAIYAIKPDGEMQFYRFEGMADGSNRWAVQQKVIGVGWQDFRQVTAGATAGTMAAPQMTLKPPVLPTPPTPPTTPNERCESYARSAVRDYEQGARYPECAAAMRRDEPRRWNNQLQLHYDWCVKAQEAWITSERTQRDRLLLHCGARSTL